MIQAFRTPIAATAIAAIGAAAVITAPPDNVARTHTALATPSTAEVALEAWQNPFAVLLDSGEMAENYVFGGYYNGADAPTPGAGEANWPAAGFSQTGGDVLNFLLTQESALGRYFYVGFLENFAAEAYLPAVQQWQINVEDYISVVLSGLNRAARALATGQWAEAVTSVRDAVTYVVANVGAKAKALVAAIPQIVKTFAGTAIGSTKVLAAKTSAVLTGVVTGLRNRDLQAAWNAAVDGTLGPSGITGALLNLNTGAGVQTGPIVNPATDIPRNFVPSVRASVQAAQWTVRGALQAKPTTLAPPAATAGETPSAVAVPDTVDAQTDKNVPGAEKGDTGHRRAVARDRGHRAAAPAASRQRR